MYLVLSSKYFQKLHCYFTKLYALDQLHAGVYIFPEISKYPSPPNMHLCDTVCTNQLHVPVLHLFFTGQKCIKG